MMKNIAPGVYYLLISADATEEQARAAYIRRYSKNPQQVLRIFLNREWWVGPVPDRIKQVGHGHG